MFRDDWVYAGHMLDMRQQALDKPIGKDKPLAPEAVLMPPLTATLLSRLPQSQI
jgi:hypothetical protein